MIGNSIFKCLEKPKNRIKTVLIPIQAIPDRRPAIRSAIIGELASQGNTGEAEPPEKMIETTMAVTPLRI
ncbi:hypothetical protein D3C86_2245400 [compost metagenome]